MRRFATLRNYKIIAADEAMIPRLLFVCGVQRSGTTALGTLLNSHPSIVLGIERYKNVYSKIRSPTALAALFEKDRFFEYEDGDTNLGVLEGKFAANYLAMRDRFDLAAYVGDKNPGFYRKYRWLWRMAPGARVVHILRDPVEVSASWEHRAREGSWPAKNDHAAAVEAWNAGIRLALAEAARTDVQLAFIRYDQIFFGGSSGLERLLDWLELPLEEEIARALGSVQKHAANLAASRRVDAAIRNHVMARADWTSFEALCAHSI